MINSVKRKNYLSNRDEYILDKVVNMNVLHVGACDWPYCDKKIKNGTLLYTRIDKYAKDQLGIDLDKESVKKLGSLPCLNSKIIVKNMDDMHNLKYDADIIVFGETLEHLTNPGIAIGNLKKSMSSSTELLISVPNATYLNNFLYAFFGRESQHPDHKLAFTFKTLTQLIEYSGLEVKEVHLTWITDNESGLNIFGRVSVFLIKMISKVFPLFSSTLMVSAKLKNDNLD